jgi:hypothetical protein
MIHQKIRHDPASALIRAVLTLARGEAALDEHRGTSWASATFTGMRHVMRVTLAGSEGVATGEWLASILPDHEFCIRGHLVADIAISAVHRRAEGTPAMTLTIEALTVEAD